MNGCAEDDLDDLVKAAMAYCDAIPGPDSTAAYNEMARMASTMVLDPTAASTQKGQIGQQIIAYVQANKVDEDDYKLLECGLWLLTEGAR